MNDSFVNVTTDFVQKLDIPLIKQCVVVDSLSSTNRYAKNLAIDGAVEGTVVVAKTQEHGRGRFDRLWESPAGGVYVSVVLRPETAPGKNAVLSLLGAVAVAHAMEGFDVSPRIKWPNDVLVSGKKIAGVLLESGYDEKQRLFVILGIGVNVNNVDFSDELRSVATSLQSELKTTVDYYCFLKKLLTQLDMLYMKFCSNDTGYILDAWRKKTDTLGRMVRIGSSGEEIEGWAEDIDSDGFLLVKLKNGVVQRVTSGDCLYFS